MNSELPEVRIRDVAASLTDADEQTLEAMRKFYEDTFPTFPEHLFKKYLLPLSYQPASVEGLAAYGEFSRDTLLEWRRLVGSYTSDIRVLAADGSTLYICPGLFPEPVVQAERTGSSLRWADVVQEAIRDNSIHPALGEQRLIKFGMDSMPTITPEEHENHRKRWNLVWARYGVNGAAPATTTDHTAAATSRDDDLLEEEDDV